MQLKRRPSARLLAGLMIGMAAAVLIPIALFGQEGSRPPGGNSTLAKDLDDLWWWFLIACAITGWAISLWSAAGGCLWGLLELLAAIAGGIVLILIAIAEFLFDLILAWLIGPLIDLIIDLIGYIWFLILPYIEGVIEWFANSWIGWAIKKFAPAWLVALLAWLFKPKAYYAKLHIVCGSGPVTLVSTQPGEDTERDYPFGKSGTVVASDSVTAATAKAKKAVLDDLEAQLDAVVCDGACTRSPASAASATFVTVSSTTTVAKYWLFDSYTTTVQVAGSLVVNCR